MARALTPGHEPNTKVICEPEGNVVDSKGRVLGRSKAPLARVAALPTA